ncbi:MAG: hypothetical protein RPR97_01690, partial [Colwellia sp.]
EYEQNYREYFKYLIGFGAVFIYLCAGLFTNLVSVRFTISMLLKMVAISIMYAGVAFSFGVFVFSTYVNFNVYLLLFFLYRSFFYEESHFQYFLDCYKVMVLLCALLSICIWLGGGFLIWGNTQVGRNSSIFHDPNYAAVIFSIAIILRINEYGISFRQGAKELFILPVLILALLLTFSKSGMLFLFAAFSIWLYFKNRVGFLVLVVVISLCAFNLNNIIEILSNSFPTLRIGDGLNGREIFFDLALGVIGESPFAMRESSSIADIIGLYSYRANVSFHNTYLDLSFVYGVQFTFVLIGYILLVFLIRWFDYANYKLELIIGIPLFLMSFTLLISPMGFGILSCLMGLILSRLSRGQHGIEKASF